MDSSSYHEDRLVKFSGRNSPRKSSPPRTSSRSRQSFKSSSRPQNFMNRFKEEERERKERERERKEKEKQQKEDKQKRASDRTSGFESFQRQGQSERQEQHAKYESNRQEQEREQQERNAKHEGEQRDRQHNQKEYREEQKNRRRYGYGPESFVSSPKSPENFDDIDSLVDPDLLSSPEEKTAAWYHRFQVMKENHYPINTKMRARKLLNMKSGEVFNNNLKHKMFRLLHPDRCKHPDSTPFCQMLTAAIDLFENKYGGKHYKKTRKLHKSRKNRTKRYRLQ